MIPRDHAIIPAPSHDVVAYQEPHPHGGQKQVPSPPRKRVMLYVGVPLALLLAWGAFGHWRTHEAAAETRRQQQDFVPEVRVATAQVEDAPIDLALPGQTEAFDTANIYPRATGYVAERLVDIGSHVRKGELLLRIEAPDLDQQLVQAQAQVGQNQAAVFQAQAGLTSSRATSSFANVTESRLTTLAHEGWETQQNADSSIANAQTGKAGVTNAEAGIAVALANLRAQQATVQRLQALTAFERVTAPFDGVITARNVDTGDLLTADMSSTTPLLSIARTDVLRVAVYVPQSSAVSLHDGLAAKVTVPELPGHIFDGVVSRNAAALDASSRAMLTEVDVSNPDGTLRAGLFVNVSIAVPRERPGVVVPDEALVFNAKGLQVATLDDDGHAHFHPVSIYRDFGTSAELRDGLNGGEQVILTPPAELEENGKARIAKPQQDQNGGKNDNGNHKAGQQTARS
jgi:HlyD family secretion protein